ncbi:hypothetical protein Vretifemale_12413 [Volvox reticuliferus]|uniref:Uncharacterized protein n=1 Tax=Volvox reticuliferus TaxID=1737510 RepID=A0A8J4CIE4_9CHLO|nr:hypothetical protein Vretifemale_12413 [Volvox reticuliferus]
MAPQAGRTSLTSVPPTQQRQQQQQQQQMDAAEYYGLYKTARTLARSYQAVAHQKDDQVKALTREMEELKLKLQKMEAEQQRLSAGYQDPAASGAAAPANAPPGPSHQQQPRTDLPYPPAGRSSTGAAASSAVPTHTLTRSASLFMQAAAATAMARPQQLQQAAPHAGAPIRTSLPTAGSLRQPADASIMLTSDKRTRSLPQVPSHAFNGAVAAAAAPQPPPQPPPLPYGDVPMPPPVLAPSPALMAQNTAGMLVRSARSARVTGEAWSARYSEPTPPGGFEDTIIEDPDGVPDGGGGKAKKHKEPKTSITKAFKKLMSKSWRGSREEHGERAHEAAATTADGAAISGAATIGNVTTDIFATYPNYPVHNTLHQLQQQPPYPLRRMSSSGAITETAPSLPLDYYESTAAGAFDDPQGLLGAPPLPTNAEYLSLALPSTAVAEPSLAVAAPSAAAAGSAATAGLSVTLPSEYLLGAPSPTDQMALHAQRQEAVRQHHQQLLLQQQQQHLLQQQHFLQQQQQLVLQQQQLLAGPAAQRPPAPPPKATAAALQSQGPSPRHGLQYQGSLGRTAMPTLIAASDMAFVRQPGGTGASVDATTLRRLQQQQQQQQQQQAAIASAALPPPAGTGKAGDAAGMRVPRSTFGQFAQRIRNSVPAASMRRSYDGVFDGSAATAVAAATAAGGLYTSGASVNQSWSSEGPAVAMAGPYPAELGVTMPPPLRTSAPALGARAALPSQVSLNIRAAAAQLSHLPPRPMGRSAAGSNSTGFSTAVAPGMEELAHVFESDYLPAVPPPHLSQLPPELAAYGAHAMGLTYSSAGLMPEEAAEPVGMMHPSPSPVSPSAAGRGLAHGNVDIGDTAITPNRKQAAAAAAAAAAATTEAYLEGILDRLKTPSVLFTPTTAAQVTAAAAAPTVHQPQSLAAAPPPPPPPADPPLPPIEEVEAAAALASPAAESPAAATAATATVTQHLTVDEAIQTETPFKNDYDAVHDATVTTPGSSTAGASRSSAAGEDDAVLRRDLRRSVGVGWRHKALGYKNAAPSPSFYEKPLTVTRKSLSGGILLTHSSLPSAPPVPFDEMLGMEPASVPQSPELPPSRTQAAAAVVAPATSPDPAPAARVPAAATAPLSIRTSSSGRTAAVRAAELLAMDSPKAAAPPSSPTGTDDEEAYKTAAENSSPPSSLDAHRHHHHRHHHHRHHRHRHHRSHEHEPDRTPTSPNKSERRTAVAGGGGGGGSRTGSDAAVAAPATATEAPCAGDINNFRTTTITATVSIIAGSNAGAGGGGGGGNVTAYLQSPHHSLRRKIAASNPFVGSPRKIDLADQDKYDTAGTLKMHPTTTKTTATSTTNGTATTLFTATMITTGHVPSADVDCQPDGGGRGGGDVGAIWLTAPIASGSCSGGTTGSVSVGGSVKVTQGSARYAAAEADEDSSSAPSTSRSENWSADASPRHPYDQQRHARRSDGKKATEATAGLDGNATLALAAAKLVSGRKTIIAGSGVSGLAHDGAVGLTQSVQAAAAAAAAAAGPVTRSTCLLPNAADVALSDYPSARSNPSASARLLEGAGGGHSGGATPSSSSRHVSVTLAPSPSPPVSASDSSVGSWDPNQNNRRGTNNGGTVAAAAGPSRKVVTVAAAQAPATGGTLGSGPRRQSDAAAMAVVAASQPLPQQSPLLASGGATATAAALRLQQNLVEVSSQVLEPLAARKRGAVRRRSLSTGLDAAGTLIEPTAGASAAQLASAGRGVVAAAATDDELSARTAQSTTIGAPPPSVSTVIDHNSSDANIVVAHDVKRAALQLQTVVTATDSQAPVTDCGARQGIVASDVVVQPNLRRSQENMDEPGESKAAKAHLAQQQHLLYLQQRQQLLQQRQTERFVRQRSAKVIQRAWRTHAAAMAKAAKLKAATVQHEEEELRREQAALVIQRGWQVYRRRTAAAIVPSPALPLASPPSTPVAGRSASASSVPGTPVLVLLPLSQQQPVCVRVPSARMCSSGGLKRRLFHPVTYSLDGLGRGPVLDTDERLRLLRGSLSKSEGGWSASMDESVFVQQPEMLRRSSSTGGASPTLYASFPQPAFTLPDNADDDICGVPGPGSAAAAAAAAPAPAAGPAAAVATPVATPLLAVAPLAAPQPVRASLDLLSVETAAAALSVPAGGDASLSGQGWPAGLTIRCPSSPPRDLMAGGGSGVLISAASPNTQPPSATSPKPPNPLASPMYFGNDVLIRTAGTDSDLMNGRSRSRVIAGGASGPRPIGHDGDVGDRRDRPVGRSGGVSLISASWDGGRMLPERRVPSMESTTVVRRSDGGGSSGGGSGGGGGFVESLRAMRTDVTLLAQLAGVAMDNCLAWTEVKPPPPPPAPLGAQHTPKHHQQPPLPPPQQQQQQPRAPGRDELVRTSGGLPPPHSQPRQPLPPPPAPSPSWAPSPCDASPNVTAALGPTEPFKPSSNADTAAVTPPSIAAAAGTPDLFCVPVAPSPDGFCRTGAEELAEFEAIEAAVAAASSGSSRERHEPAVVAPVTAGDYSGDEDDALITSSRCFTTTPPTARLLSCGSSSDEDDGVPLQLGLEHIEVPAAAPPPPVAVTQSEQVTMKPDGAATPIVAAAEAEDVIDDDSESDESLSALCQPLPSARTPAAYGTSRLAIGMGSPATISTTTSASTMAGDEGSAAAGKGGGRSAGGDAKNMPSPVRWHTSELWEIAHLQPMTPTPVATPTEAAADAALRRSWPCPRPAAPVAVTGIIAAAAGGTGVGVGVAAGAGSGVNAVDTASVAAVGPWTSVRHVAGGANIGGGRGADHAQETDVAVFAERVSAAAVTTTTVDYTMSEPAACSSPMAGNIQRTTRTSSPVRWHTSQLWEIVNQSGGGGMTPPPLMTPRGDGNGGSGSGSSSGGGAVGPSMGRRAWSAPQAADARPPLPVVTTTAVAAVAPTATTAAAMAAAAPTATTAAAMAAAAPTATTAAAMAAAAPTTTTAAAMAAAAPTTTSAAAMAAAPTTTAALAAAPAPTATMAVAAPTVPTTTSAGGDGGATPVPTCGNVSVTAPAVASLLERSGSAVTSATASSPAGGGAAAPTTASTTVARNSSAAVRPAPPPPAAAAAVKAAVPLAVAAAAAPAAAKAPVEVKRTAGSPTLSTPAFGGFSTVGSAKAAASPSFGYVGRPQLTISHHRFDDIVTCAPPPPTPSTPPPPQAAAAASSSATGPAPPPGVHVLSGETVSGLKLSATQSRPKVPSPGPSLDTSEPQAPAAPALAPSSGPAAAAAAGIVGSGASGGGAAASNLPNKAAAAAATSASASATLNVSAKTAHAGSTPGSGAKSIPTAPASAASAASAGSAAAKTSSASPTTRGLSKIPSFSTPNAATATSQSRPGSAEKADKATLPSVVGGGGGGGKSRSSSPSTAQGTTIPSTTKAVCGGTSATATSSATAARPDSQRRPALGQAVTNVVAAATAAVTAAAPVAAGGATNAAAAADAVSPLSDSRRVASSSSNSSDLTGTSVNLPSYDSGTTIAYIIPKSANSKAEVAMAPAPTGTGGHQQERRRYTSSPSVTGTRLSSPLTGEVESDASPRLGLPPHNTFYPSSSATRRFSVGSLPLSSDLSGDGDGDGDGDGGSADGGGSTPCSVQQQQSSQHQDAAFHFYHNPHFDSGVGNPKSELTGSPEDALDGARERFMDVVNVPAALTGGDKIRTIQAAVSAAGMMGVSGAAAAAAAANRLRSSSSRREQADAEAFCMYGGLSLTGDSSDSENN